MEGGFAGKKVGSGIRCGFDRLLTRVLFKGLCGLGKQNGPRGCVGCGLEV